MLPSGTPVELDGEAMWVWEYLCWDCGHESEWMSPRPTPDRFGCQICGSLQVELREGAGGDVEQTSLFSNSGG